MKKIREEFKKFIARGNVVDLAVGVIIGSAFTAIVTALTENILRPLINWVITLCIGDSSITAYTFLKKVETDGVIDMSASVYIDWGAFLGAVVNFLLIALVLFLIVKMINAVGDAGRRAESGFRTRREAVKKYRKEGLSGKEAVARYEKELKEEEEAKAAAAKAAAEEAARKAEEKETANTRLLEEIRDLLKNK